MGKADSSCSETSSTQALPSGFLSEIRPDLFGLVFHISWLFLLLYSNSLYPSPEITEATLTIPSNIVYFSSFLALSMTLLFGILKTKTFMELAEKRVVVIAAPLITSFGTLFYVVEQSHPLTLFIVLGGILTGVGSAILAARWASVYGNTSIKTILFNVPLIFVAVVAICISVNYLPQYLRFALLVVLPCVSGACLQFSRNTQKKLSVKQDFHRENPSKRKRSKGAIVGLIAFIGINGFMMGCLPLLPEETSSLWGASYNTILHFATSLLFLAFVGITIYLEKKESFLPLFFGPLILLVILILPFTNTLSAGIEGVLFPLGSISFELLLVFGTVLFALLFDYSPAKTFMVGRLTYALTDMAGGLFGTSISGSGNMLAVVQIGSVFLFALIELFVILFIVFLFGSRKTKASAGETFFASSENPGSIASSAPSSNKESLSQVLKRLGEEYGLSQREMEVFSLLAAGRTSSRIQEELHIASGTVNYHTHNIYQKLNVHNRQEILDLVEARENPQPN